MATPSNYTDVGWYKYGTIPGEEGSAVIAGHRSNALFLPAVFFTLKNISVGDSVYVTNGAGKKMHFIVREIETYDYTQVPLQELFHEGGAPLLKLITCEGPWLQKDKTARERRIVTAVLQE
jgi:LPXTG-site transpeptidase (sortase) family protein